MPVLSKGSNPKWSRKSHLDRLGPVPDGTFCSIWKSTRVRTGCPSPGRLLPVSPRVPCAPAPPARFVSGARERKGALLSEGPLGGLEAKPGFEPGVKALQASALPLGHFAEKGPLRTVRKCNGADNGARTRDPNLGKVVLYQLSHVRLRVINIRDAAGGRKEFFKDC